MRAGSEADIGAYFEKNIIWSAQKTSGILNIFNLAYYVTFHLLEIKGQIC